MDRRAWMKGLVAAAVVVLATGQTARALPVVHDEDVPEYVTDWLDDYFDGDYDLGLHEEGPPHQHEILDGNGDPVGYIEEVDGDWTYYPLPSGPGVPIPGP